MLCGLIQDCLHPLELLLVDDRFVAVLADDFSPDDLADIQRVAENPHHLLLREWFPTDHFSRASISLGDGDLPTFDQLSLDSTG